MHPTGHQVVHKQAMCISSKEVQQPPGLLQAHKHCQQMKCPQDKRQWAQIEIQNIQFKHKKYLCFCCFVKVFKQGTRLPRQVVESGPWRYSNPSWTQQHALPNPTLSRWLEYVISRDTCQPQLLCDFVN